jgi:tetratricopeptide (TPR) repeat protein
MFCTHMGWAEIETAVPIARRAALAAIQSDSEDAWPHHALACAHLFERRVADALAEFELALRLNPNFSPARGYYSLALSYSGRWADADRAAHRALYLSPRDPFAQVYSGIRGFAQFLGGNYAEAIRLASEATRERSEFAGGYRVLTASAGMAGATDMAAHALARLRRAQPNISLEWIRTQMPFEHDADRQHYMEGHRRAGLT